MSHHSVALQHRQLAATGNLKRPHSLRGVKQHNGIVGALLRATRYGKTIASAARLLDDSAFPGLAKPVLHFSGPATWSQRQTRKTGNTCFLRTFAEQIRTEHTFHDSHLPLESKEHTEPTFITTLIFQRGNVAGSTPSSLALSTRRMILPLRVLGKDGTNSMSAGTGDGRKLFAHVLLHLFEQFVAGLDDPGAE
jgi:hypothetical protein